MFDQSSTPATFQLSRREWLIAGLGSSLLTVGGCRTTTSPVSPATLSGIVQGDSMAPHYLGTTGLLRCDTCGERQSVSLAYGTQVDWCCPRCGVSRATDILEVVTWQAPQVTLVAPSETAEPFERFEPVAIAFDDQAVDQAATSPTDQSVSSPTTWTLKRIWGLPGERVGIENGAWKINGKIVTRDWPTQCELRVLVCADRASRWGLDHWSNSASLESPEVSAKLPNTAPVWSPRIEAATSLSSPAVLPWQPTANGWSLASASSDEAVPSVLQYQHRRCVIANRNPTSQPLVAPVDDFLAFDPFRTRRLHPVYGLMLEAAVELAEDAELSLALHDGTNWVTLKLSNRNCQLTLTDSDQELARTDWSSLDKPFHIGISTFDQRITWALDHQQAGSIELAGRSSRSRATVISEPARLSGFGSIEITELRLWRDLHLLGPNPSDDSWQLDHPLADDEYFVIGDHFAASIDNRLSQQGTRRHEIIGRVERRAAPGKDQ